VSTKKIKFTNFGRLVQIVLFSSSLICTWVTIYVW